MTDQMKPANAPLYPPIDPVPPGTARPFVSVMIPTYNCADYLRHTLQSVLSQAPPDREMQIEVIDDCSRTDDPEAVVRELGRNRVSFYRQPTNRGAQATFTTCVARATGEWVHILHGDDMIADGFYDALRAAAASNPGIGAMFCGVQHIDERNALVECYGMDDARAGVVTDLMERLAIYNLIRFPSMVVKRDVYEHLGGFHPALFHSADWDMWKRVSVHYPVWYEPRPLALYRVHGPSDTSQLMRTGANILDARRAIDVATTYLPPADAARLSALARRYHALYAMELAHEMLATRSWLAAWRQLIAGLRCCSDYGVWIAAASVVGDAVRRSTRRPAPHSL
jgi:glycosyltransferase involved in cell wall biosynthesis